MAHRPGESVRAGFDGEISENGRKVKAGIRWSYPVVEFSRFRPEPIITRRIPLPDIKDVGVPRSLGFRSHGTRNPPKNSFYSLSTALLSECNLSLIFEQVTMGSRVPKNGEPIRVPGFWKRGTHPGSRERNPKLTSLQDIIIVFLLPPSYCFLEFSRRNICLSHGFPPKSLGIGCRNHCSERHPWVAHLVEYFSQKQFDLLCWSKFLIIANFLYFIIVSNIVCGWLFV
jgi:hypothetical protein